MTAIITASARSKAPLAHWVIRLWHDMDLPITGRKIPGTIPVAVLAALIELATAAIWIGDGLTLAFPEAEARLTVARHVLDSSSPLSLAVLGHTWLPLPQLLLAPLVVVTPAWHTGWAAAILGAGCLAVTAAGLYRVAARWGGRRSSRLVTVAAVVLNPSMLFLTSTALAEPVLIACLAACLAGLSHFAVRSRLSSPGEVAIFAGIPAAGAALSGYEGWTLTVTAVVFVAAVAWRRTHQGRTVAASVLGMAAPTLLAVGAWLSFNWVSFGDPLAFLPSASLADPARAGLSDPGIGSTGDIVSAVTTTSVAAEGAAGWPLLVLAGLGLAAALITFRDLNKGLFLVASATPFLFTILGLFLGITTIWNRAVFAGVDWNNRLGMAVIVPVAILSGTLVEAVQRDAQRHGWVRLTIGVAVVALAIQPLWFAREPGRSLVIAEAQHSQVRTTDSRQAAAWLAANYDGGGILLDETTWSNAVLPTIGLPLREYRLVSDRWLFTNALADPSGEVDWVWASRKATDPVTALTGRAGFATQFAAVFTNDTIIIYRLRGSR